MECDSDHAIIEKIKKRTQMRINHLYDWVQLVRTCKVQKPFKVVVMTLNNFFDNTELKSKKGPFAVKKLDDSGDKFLWQPIKWLQYNKNSEFYIKIKTVNDVSASTDPDLDEDNPDEEDSEVL
ncbi:unnamed protein product [Euphydryas editha]|uniref:Uncharacterized protein n=1 Tax=Euphydryas editha TaxID=104508 RepID=A0AAU9V156_EUPED|nr:unnamed protein product [Euphydryas editha]